MARVRCDAFLDPSNTASSLAASCSRSINTYLEAITPGQGKSPLWVVRTPGLRPFLNFPDTPIRGLFQINGRAFAVGGETFAEIFEDGSYGPTFDVAAALTPGEPVPFASSGSIGDQVMFLSGGLGYIYDLDADTLTQITDGDFPAVAQWCEWMDGYFLVSEANSRRFRWSSLGDGLTWPSLSFADRSEAPDNIQALIRNHREIWIMGGRTSEVWYNAGDVNNTFAPLQGVFLEHGTGGPSTVRRVDNTLIWLVLNDDGQGIVMRADGYTPRRVSTFAVETWIQRSGRLGDFEAWTYQERGHLFYVLQPPIPDDSDATLTETTWVYDLTMDRWHERATWNPEEARWMPHLAGCHVYVFDRHLVGSRVDGTIYEMSMDYYDEEIEA